MAYIKRNEQGKICALHEHSLPGTEYMDIDNPELVEFINNCNTEDLSRLAQSDLQMIRVLEDLIEVLISKNVIAITDFPSSVIDKLLARQSIRKRLSGAIGMEYGDDKK